MGKKQAFVIVVVGVSAILCLRMLKLEERMTSWIPMSIESPGEKRRTLEEKKPGTSQWSEDKGQEKEETNLFEGVDFSFMMNKVINCSRPFIMMEPRGQLGNQLGEASHMIALKLKYQVQVGVRKDMYDHLMATFPNFPLPPLPEECTNRTDIRGMLLHDAENYVALHGLDIYINIGWYPCHPAFFIQYRDLLRFFYRFYSSVQQSAEKYQDILLQKWRKKMTAASLENGTIQAPGNERPVVVGVHVRRTSYIHHMDVVHGSKVMEPIFFSDAFAFARKRYGKVAFIVVSDDIPWTRENVVEPHPDAVALDDRISRDEDMALMALSDHFLYGLGTFAMFGGILSHGDIIYATNVSYDLKRPYEMEVWMSAANHESLIPLHYRKSY